MIAGSRQLYTANQPTRGRRETQKPDAQLTAIETAGVQIDCDYGRGGRKGSPAVWNRNANPRKAIACPFANHFQSPTHLLAGSAGRSGGRGGPALTLVRATFPFPSCQRNRERFWIGFRSPRIHSAWNEPIVLRGHSAGAVVCVFELNRVRGESTCN